MTKHLLTGALLLAWFASCSSEPLTDQQPADGGTPAPAATKPAEAVAPQPSTAEKLKLTYYNVDG